MVKMDSQGLQVQREWLELMGQLGQWVLKDRQGRMVKMDSMGTMDLLGRQGRRESRGILGEQGLLAHRVSKVHRA